MKKTILLFIGFILLFMPAANAQMVLEYDIATANTEIALPLAGTVNVNVDWGDGSVKEAFTTAGNKTHTFATTGTKTVTITGTMTAYGGVNSAGNARLIKVVSWDGLGLKNLSLAFYGAKNLTQVPLSLPPTVTNLRSMFSNAKAFNQPIGAWNTAVVTDMSRMFFYASTFNQPIGTWNTAAVTDMSEMFYEAIVFNQPIGTWNTAAVTDMNSMFEQASAFDQSIGSWNTAAVTDMNEMFYYASKFNQPIGMWNTAAVTDISRMFDHAISFNQPIGTWNTAAVTSMTQLFSVATSFNQPIGTWDVTSVANMGSTFFNTALCTDNYDNLLNGWATQAVKTGVFFDGGNSKYSSASSAARTTLISKGWTIKDAGLGTTVDAKCTITGIEDYNFTSKVDFYPNPVLDKLSIHFSSPLNELVTYSVFNTRGEVVLENKKQINGSVIEMELNDIPQGAYILKITTSDKNIVETFIKQ